MVPAAHGRKPLRLQLWCWNFAPEATAMGAVATKWACAMRDLGYEVEVVSAHPHYPPGLYRTRFLPRRESVEGITVTRLPLLVGHQTTRARVAEELTFTLSGAAALPFLAVPDVVVAVSPSFLGLLPAIAHAKLRRRPLVLWLQDIFPDAAATTGLLTNRPALTLARRWERIVYREADRVVVIARSFEQNLLRKGVPASKLVTISNPATRGLRLREANGQATARRLLYVGNIGHSQGLAELVKAFGRSSDDGMRLVIAGTGERLAEVSAAAGPGVEVLGLVTDERLELELERATLAVVSQRPDVAEFNVPSRLMMLMARGIPVLACVRPDSEVARIVRESGGGWVADAEAPAAALALARQALHEPGEIERRGNAAFAYAARCFDPRRIAEHFAEVLTSL